MRYTSVNDNILNNPDSMSDLLKNPNGLSKYSGMDSITYANDNKETPKR